MNDELAQEILLQLQGKSEVRLLPGIFRGFEVAGGRMLVDFDQGRVPAYSMTPWRPKVNDPVWVEITDGVAYVRGPTVNPPADGTVVSVASGIAVVSTDIGNVDATYELGVTPTAGQQVKLFSGNGFHIIAVKSTTPTAPTAPDGAATGTGTFTREFTAVDAGSYRSYWWQSQVWASDNNFGAWFYGNKIGDTVPAAAEILRVQLYLSVVQKFGFDPNFALHNHDVKPGGAPSLFSATAIGFGGSGWIDLPISFGQSLRRSGSAKGVGVEHGGYNIFASLGQDPNSGRIRIQYRT